jgi:nucleotide-binding universal stress UspA family protein
MKILVGIDGSDMSHLVAAEAAKLAARLGGSLTLFRAVTLPPDLPPSFLVMAPDDVQKALVEGAERNLREVAARLPAGLVAGKRVEINTPWRGLVTAAKELHADLVVIGAHSHHGIERLLGTTAGKVVDHCDRSVMVVRPH